MFQIFDWAGNLKFNGQRWSSFDDAEEFLGEHLGDSYEEDRQEFYIVESKRSLSRDY